MIYKVFCGMKRKFSQGGHHYDPNVITKIVSIMVMQSLANGQYHKVARAECYEIARRIDEEEEENSDKGGESRIEHRYLL
ncbi:unnamed protein product [Caenorhabditis sp. 36 PRJEB53466]|nr:unnamed protein product [Caenorhabditis sp. 36 PRJEB53466]